MLTRDEWLGLIQDFLEARMEDAPDQSCKTFAGNLWQDAAEVDWGTNRECEESAA